MGANQHLRMGSGAFNSLSQIQFGSSSLTGRNLNAAAFEGPELNVGDVQGGVLPIKADTWGTNNIAMSWRTHASLPYSSRTRGSTFTFGD